jgi:transcriptional regulator with XRE-family HTH domain
MKANFASQLKLLRTTHYLTQASLSDIMGVSARTIGYYESGIRFPNDEQILHRLADYFDVSCDYLLGRANKRNDELRDALYKQYSAVLTAEQLTHLLALVTPIKE